MTTHGIKKVLSRTGRPGARRISSDLVIGLMGIVIVTAGLSIGLGHFFMNLKAGSELQQEADQYLSYLTESLELPVWSMDDETVKKIADAYFISRLFSLLEITSNEYDQKFVYLKKKPNEDEMVVRTGQLTHGGHLIGSIRLGLSKMPYKNELRRQLRSSLWLAVIIGLAMAATISFLLRFLVNKPLQLLMDVAEDMAHGNYERRENKIKHYEIAMVHDQLVTMAGRVQGREASLENANIQLRKEITLREDSEQELHRLQNYLYNIINSMPSILVAVDRDGNVTQWNNRTQQATGLSFEEARSQPIAEAFPRLAGEMERINTSIKERRVINSLKTIRKIDTEIRFEDITIFPLVANGVEGAVIRVDDVTEQVRLEEMMIQNEKMLTVGGLAAGMAHEINNPLAGMMQTAEVMAGRLKNNLHVPANQRAAEAAGTTLEAIEQFMTARGIPRMLSTITTSGKRVAAIVDNMLSFARKSDASITFHCLGDLLDKTVELAATDYDLKKQYDFKRIKIQKEYGQNLPDVPCEGAKIQQVLLNILRNGAHAMQAAGTESPRLVFRTRFEPERKMAIIEIEDNGPGMNEQTRKRVFEPFFTTKAVGEGTGLGLSVSYFIITENHRGEMAVESHPGAGAKFIIRLPV